MTLIATSLIYNIQNSLQQITNNVKFTSSAGGITWAIYNWYWARWNRIVGTEYNFNTVCSVPPRSKQINQWVVSFERV